MLTRRGKPLAEVVPLRDGMDAEPFGLSHNRAFIELINRSWDAYQKRDGVSDEEARRLLGLGKPARKACRSVKAGPR